MKKILALLFLSFFIHLCYAQLPNGLMGIQVGYSYHQVDSVISSFKKVKVTENTYKLSTNIEVSGKFISDGIKWNILRVELFNDHVIKVQLEKSSRMSSLANEALKLMEKYKDQYLNYMDDIETEDEGCFKSKMTFSCCRNRNLCIYYFMCLGGILYLTCSGY